MWHTSVTHTLLVFFVCCIPLLGGEAECFPCGLHDLSGPGFILRALRAQETAQLVLLLGKNCTAKMLNHTSLENLMCELYQKYHPNQVRWKE